MHLPVIPPKAEPPLFVATSAAVGYADGFYQEEQDGLARFRWVQERAVLDFAPAAETRLLECWLLSVFTDLSQVLTVATSGDTQSYPLVNGWTPISIHVPAGVGAVALLANKRFPPEYYPGDHRSLAVRVRDVRLHADADRHTALNRQYENSRLNQQEVLAGQTTLTSTPPSLGIDLHGVCNVKPPCVYCEWDFSKGLEGRARRRSVHARHAPRMGRLLRQHVDPHQLLDRRAVHRGYIAKHTRRIFTRWFGPTASGNPP